MQEKSLEDFFGEEEKVEEKKTQPTEKIHEDIQSWIEFNREFKAKMAVQPLNLKNVYLLSATYDGEKRCAVLKFYNPTDGRIYLWYDNTGHKPYCLTSLPPEELEKISEVMLNEGLDHFEVVKKFNPLLDQNVKVTKIVAHDPLTIGGKPSGSLRDIIPKTRPEAKIWEADIKYYENYLYDRNLEVGIPYNLENGKLIPVRVENKSFLEQIKQVFMGEQKEFLDYILNWVQLLETPVPNLRYVALDIEVESPTVDRVPEPREALYKVICVSFVGSDDLKKVLLLRRDNVEEGDFRLPSDVKLEYCDSEVELFVKVFKLIVDYPIVVTFNGDEFDLRYLWHRAQKLGFPKEEIPIQMGREYAMLTYGIHIDLYRFFFNKAIQTYAFDQKYKEVTLQDISQILLGIGKISLEKNISDLTYLELAAYCLRDSELTFGLASFDDHLVMKLIVALTRIAKMPMEDVSRQGVSNWIRSLMYKEHRKNGYLIPTSDEILAEKGVTSTHAVIKGKKYRGAVVIEPKPGVNFNVVVLDFSSLYPSIIKKWNLSYETIRCPHEECKDNLIPETNHWVCKKKLGLTSLVIGSLRDLRVRWYKVKAKDQSFPSELRRWYSVIQRTLKVILNAAYGVFGAEHFVLYCPPVAEATTSIGRYAIKSTISKAQELGIEVVYGDSVTGETPIIVRKNGNIDIIPIEDLECEDVNSLEILSIKGFTRIRGFIKREVEKEFFRVNTYDGVVDVTEDHGLINHKGEPISPKELKEGVSLLYPTQTLNDDLTHDITNCRNEMSREEAEVLGLFVADGSCSYIEKAKRWIWKIDSKDLDLLEKAKKKIEKVFNVKCKIWNCKKSSNVYRLSLSGNNYGTVKKIASYFRSICYTKKSGIKRIPQSIINGSREIKEAFLKGYFLGDGNIYKGYRSMDDNPIVIAQLKFLYETLGYKTRIECREDKPKVLSLRLLSNPLDPRTRNDNLVRKVYSLGKRKTIVYDVSTENETFIGGWVPLHNTDSVFLKSPKEEQTRMLVEWSRNVLGMELDVDKAYRYSVFSTRKKNYIGVYPDGNVEIKGLTGKKRNTPEFLKKAFVEMVKILGEVKSEVEFMEAKEKIKKIVKECYTKLKNKEYSLEELAFTVVLGKDIEDYEKTTPQHVKALKRLSEEEREKIGAGSIIRYVKIRREPGVKLLALASLDEIDVEKYVEHIRTTFEQVLDALDISFDEIVGVSKLESFFNN